MSQIEFESSEKAASGAAPPAAMSEDDLAAVAGALRDLWGHVSKLKAENAALAARIETLDRRNLEVEKQAAEFRWRGDWQPTEEYRKNNFIRHDGSVWICLRDTEGRPGQSLDWQMALRRGRDGKDARAAA